MFKTPMHNHTIKRIAALILLGALGAAGSVAVARADGILTPQEQRFGNAIAGSLCSYINTAGVTQSSMLKAMQIIYENTPTNVDESDTVDIINYVVETYCPEHWRELVSFGEGYRHA